MFDFSLRVHPLVPKIGSRAEPLGGSRSLVEMGVEKTGCDMAGDDGFLGGGVAATTSSVPPRDGSGDAPRRPLRGNRQEAWCFDTESQSARAHAPGSFGEIGSEAMAMIGSAVCTVFCSIAIPLWVTAVLHDGVSTGSRGRGRWWHFWGLVAAECCTGRQNAELGGPTPGETYRLVICGRRSAEPRRWCVDPWYGRP